ncbi:ead/Ea22-like family protein [Pseudomonas aeruginosa]|uniref:ead/Ea22-like family protein n=1 Tax=Pseudomonas aeruginosa TaxID=287 RepID=UPI003CF457ED
MTDHAELRRLAKAATPGPWEYQAPLKILAADRTSIVLIALSHTNYREDEANSRLIAAANPKTILALLDEIDGMKASGWRNHSVNYARAEKCPQTLETAQAAWDRDQELIEEQRQQIARDSQMINQLRQKLQSVEVDRDRLKAENEALLLGMRAILNAYDYADQYNKEGVAVEVMEDLRTLFKGATQ